GGRVRQTRWTKSCVSENKRPSPVERPGENCGEDGSLPGIETDDSRADRGAIVGEEVKESGVRIVGRIRDWWIRVAVWIVRVLKIDEILKVGAGVAIVSGVKDAVGPTKFSYVTSGRVDQRRSCAKGGA